MRPDSVGLGGFDSHAFPPLLALLVSAVMLFAAPGRSDAVPPPLRVGVRDTVAQAGADSTGSGAARARRRANRLGEQPRMIMLRSLLVPGWGQLHNHAWIKAAGVAGAEGWLVRSILRDRDALDGLKREVDAAQGRNDEAAYIDAANRYNSKLDGYVGGQWLLGGLLTYALVDAYVDAHFRNFEIEFRTDPALPREAAPEDARGASGGLSRSRLSLRWHF